MLKILVNFIGWQKGSGAAEGALNAQQKLPIA